MPGIYCYFMSAIITLWVGGCAPAAARPAHATILGIQGSRFTLDGQPAFLLGISYYGGLGAPPETVAADLDRIRASGFNWIRVWAKWSAFGGNVSEVDTEGWPRKPYIDRLVRLIAECEKRKLIVDETLTRSGPEVMGGLHTEEAHAQAVRILVTELRAYRNWYLDIANERNIRDGRYVLINVVARLAQVARNIDPRRLLTASHGSEISREEMEAYLTRAHLDFVCPHRTRNEGSPRQTEEKTRELLRWMKEIGSEVPVHYQDPFRRGNVDWNPGVADYLADAGGASRGGAAGWCLHNGSGRSRGTEGSEPRRSFDLSRIRLLDQLDAVELEVASILVNSLRGVPSR